jgi:cysteinyl-tRNA synthetase
VADLHFYNSLTRTKERFEPSVAGRVGLYLCGPTVYGPAHLGHARSAIVFDVLARFLRSLEYKVRYVRNITDVGHLLHDADEGEDKIASRARLEQIEPMEVAHQYADSYHADMAALGCLPPSIEPRATGHITEQIEMVEKLVAEGMAYEANGSVYFDVAAFQARYGTYGKLSGRVPEDLLSGTRNLDGQQEKRNPADFALWKRAEPIHIMRWNSPWGEGFPGWHIECSAMGAKYLGTSFDIHGGGLDLLFPHHEAEMAQGQACHNGTIPARYWMHVNMVQVNGQKMGKSLGNAISLQEFFTGSHPLLDQAYSPQIIRFFILQAHYRSTVDFSNEALQAAAKGLRRLLNGLLVIERLEEGLDANPLTALIDSESAKALELAVQEEIRDIHAALADDLNTALALAGLYALLKRVNTWATWQTRPELWATLSPTAFSTLATTYRHYLSNIFNLAPEPTPTAPLREGLLDLYKTARKEKNWTQVEALRSIFKAAGLTVQDGKTDSVWAYEE